MEDIPKPRELTYLYYGPMTITSVGSIDNDMYTILILPESRYDSCNFIRIDYLYTGKKSEWFLKTGAEPIDIKKDRESMSLMPVARMWVDILDKRFDEAFVLYREHKLRRIFNGK
jgi:hypothetical protein